MPDAPGQMTVRVRDHEAEKERWGRGMGGPIVRTVVIPSTCRRCGGPRGEVRGTNQSEDGEYYNVSSWTNPCGHVDYFDAVLAEARHFATTGEFTTEDGLRAWAPIWPEAGGNALQLAESVGPHRSEETGQPLGATALLLSGGHINALSRADMRMLGAQITRWLELHPDEALSQETADTAATS